jgi:hypothetical protein
MEEESNMQFNYAAKANDTLVQLRRQIDSISSTANNHYAEAQSLRDQHTAVASPSVGFCVHCHNHGAQIATSTVYDEVEIQRQNILH